MIMDRLPTTNETRLRPAIRTPITEPTSRVPAPPYADNKVTDAPRTMTSDVDALCSLRGALTVVGFGHIIHLINLACKEQEV